MMPSKNSSPHLKRLVLLVWILIAFFYFYLSYDYIHASNNDRTFGDYVHYVVQLAGNEHRSSKEVRALVLVKAGQLNIPLSGDEITITGGGTTLDVAFDYGVDIYVPVLHRIFYHKVFYHDVRFVPLR
jgi:hypothetical protein